MKKRRRPQSSSARDYPRTARVNELLREIIGDELERLGDSRLDWVSITAVEVNPELTSAKVWFSTLGGPEGDPEILEGLAERRRGLQAAIGRQARLRRTPELHFAPDSGVRAGLRMEELLAELHHDEPANDRADAAPTGAGPVDGEEDCSDAVAPERP